MALSCCRLTHHETQVPPLVEEIAVDIDAIGLRKVGGDQLPDGWQIRRLLTRVVLHVVELRSLI